MSARSVMTMRATLQRNHAREDEHGQPGPVDWRTIKYLSCYVWQPVARRSQQTNRVMESDEYGMLVPRGTDIFSGDRVQEMYDRTGTLLYEQPLYVDAVRRRRDHLEVTLREHR